MQFSKWLFRKLWKLHGIQSGSYDGVVRMGFNLYDYQCFLERRRLFPCMYAIV